MWFAKEEDVKRSHNKTLSIAVFLLLKRCILTMHKGSDLHARRFHFDRKGQFYTQMIRESRKGRRHSRVHAGLEREEKEVYVLEIS
jgi:hypothetical protein